MAPETAPPEPVPTREAISLAPEKRKIKVAKDTRLDEEKVREREVQEKKKTEQELQKKMQELQQVARQRQQEERELERKLKERQREAERKEAIRREDERKRAAAQARLEQIRAEAEARAAAEEARQLAAEARAAQEALARTRADAAAKAAAVRSAATNTTAGRQGAQSMVEQSYWGRVAERVRSKWVLPEMRAWDPTLLAQVFITINRNGDVVNIEFEGRSRDPLFDQLVEKTIRSAAPMPPFPPLMQQDTTGVGFKFKPGELGNM